MKGPCIYFKTSWKPDVAEMKPQFAITKLQFLADFLIQGPCWADATIYSDIALFYGTDNRMYTSATMKIL